jgi:hypothetical protein
MVPEWSTYRRHPCGLPSRPGSGAAVVGRLTIGMRVLKWRGGAIGQVALGVLVLRLASTDPRTSSTPASSSPLVMVTPPVATNRAAAGEWTLQIDESTLTQKLNAWATGQAVLQTPVGSARLRDLRVHIGDDGFVIRGVADTGAVAAPVVLDATASASAGRVLVHIGQDRIRDLAIPEAARRALQDWLQQQLDQWLATDHDVVQSVDIRSGRLVVIGTRR